MPALPLADHVLRIATTGKINDQNWANIYYALYSGARITNTQAGTVATSLSSGWLGAIAPLCPAGVRLTQVQVNDLSAVDGAVGLDTVQRIGTRTGTALTNQVSVCISWKIQARYRGGHPRSYWPAGVQTDIDQTNFRLWTTGFHTAALAAAANWGTAIEGILVNTVPLDFVAVSFYKGHTFDEKGKRVPTPRPVPVILPIVTNLVHYRIDSQRRRLGKEVN